MAEYQYGIISDVPITILEAELFAFAHNPPPELGGLGKAEHFWNIVAILWPEKTLDGKKNPNAFIRNPWSEKMIAEACIHRTLAVLGGLNSSKSDTFAAWAIVNWLADPWGTMVLLTSTSLGDSKRRMWSSVKKYFQAYPGLPGRLIDSLLTIKTDDGSGKTDDKCGITLIAGAKSKEKEAVGKLIGIKQGKLLFIADELPELSPALAEAYFSNLAPSNPHAQMIGIGNFSSIYDALGTFSTPKQGWGSVTVEDAEWECERGAYCIRFDGLKSPNLLMGEDKYPFLYSSKSLAKHKEAYGDNSAEFWRMCRSFPCPVGTGDTIYSEADILAGRGYETECLWMTHPTRVSAMDPSFTSGGDRSIQMFGSFGQCADGIYRLIRDKTVPLIDDVSVRAPRDYQIARAFRDNCIKEGIDPRNACMDTTAGGSVLYSIVCEEWSTDVMMVNFSGSPSDSFVRANDPTTAKNMFDRRVSELWAVGREFMKYGQLKGIDFDLAREMKARKYETVKSSEGLKICVEKKADMKKRLGFSPDIGDSHAAMIELCRQRFGWLAGGTSTGQNATNQSWEKQVETANNLYENVTYSGEQEQEPENDFVFP